MKAVKSGIAGPNRLDNLRSLRVSNIDVAFATSFGTLVSGLFLVGFIQSLGGSDLWIGLLSAIPSLVGIVQIPGAIWGRSFSSYKRFVTPGGMLWRAGYLPLLALPFLDLPAPLKLSILMGCVLFASTASTFVNPIYNEWIAEMVPANSRGTIFARRNAIGTAVGAVVGILGALLLDHFKSNRHAKTGFTVVFGLGIACAVVSMFYYLKMQDLPRLAPVRQSLREGIRAIGNPFGDTNFRRVLILLSVAVMGQQFAGSLFSAYAFESLKLNYQVMQGTAVSMAIGNVLSAKMWGFLSDKYGNKPILAIALGLLSLNPIAWMLTSPGHPEFNAWLLLSTHVLMGVFWCGINLCQFNLILATAKVEDRANYIGAGMTISALVGGVAPLLGAFTMAALRHSLPATEAYKAVFAISFFFRFISGLFLIPIVEQGSAGIRTALGDLRRITPKGMRAMRSLSRSTDVESRAKAIHNLGEQGLTLAADEVIKALHDPQPRIRRQAAEAIAQMRDSRATDELIHQVEEHPDLLEEETIDALGVLRDPRAIPTIIGTMRSPRSQLRRASARALGRIGEKTPEVVSALIRAASDEWDMDLRRTAVQTIRRLEIWDAEPVICRCVCDPHPSVRIAAAEAVAEMEMRSAAPALRDALNQYSDEASCEAAYAVGVVGELSDMGLILAEARQCVSVITRRRCLLGVARLMQVEKETYRLMLLEGMARDGALLSMLTPAIRKRPELKQVLARYSSGDEKGCFEAMMPLWPDMPREFLLEPIVDELFLAVGPYLAQLEA